MMAVVELTPRFVKNFRSFSSARFTRIRAASSFAPSAAAHFGQASVLEKPEHDGVTFLLIQPGNGRIQQRRDLRPGILRPGRWFIQQRLHVRLLFALRAATPDFQCVGGNKAGRAMQPAGENGFGSERAGLARQNDEDRLRHLLGQMWIATCRNAGRIDEVDIAGDQRLKRGLGLAGGVFPHQFHVIGHHSPNTWTQKRKANKLFQARTDAGTEYQQGRQLNLRSICNRIRRADCNKPRLWRSHWDC